MKTITQAVAHQTTAEYIAQVALEILEAEGAEAVSMRRVASAVGITPMAIYHHFSGREALLNYITDREFAKLLEYIQAQPLRGNAEAKLIRGMRFYVDYAWPGRAFLTMFSLAPVREPVDSPRTFARAVLRL